MTASRYRWVIVAAGGLMGCVAIGSMFSLPVLLRPIAAHRLVGDRRVERHDHRLSRHGLRQHGLGQPLRSGRPRAVVALTGAIALPASLALAAHAPSLARVPAAVRPPHRRQRGGDHRADDGLRDGLVRHPSQPRGLARLGGHGDGADDHVAARGLARLAPRLADDAANPRRRRGRADDPGRASGAPPAGARRRGAAPAAERSASRRCRSRRRCDRRSSSCWS